jgi:NAD(P)-dependent dehydrogenase (short-subunit alcohol dehydrogenase family)
MAMGWLEGQVALVSGGGSGIGRGIVARFIAEGACVGVLERVPERIEQLQAAFGEYVLPVQGDVTRFEDNKRAVEQTVRAFGQLDIFVGNVGVFDRYMSLVDLPEDKLGEAFDEQFAVNVKGCLLGAKAALLELLKTKAAWSLRRPWRVSTRVGVASSIPPRSTPWWG